MKLTNILGTVLASTVVVLGFSGMAASADVVEGKTAETPANVSIIDQTGPVDPSDPDQTRLTLDKVPEAYNFETLVKNKAYSVNGTLTNQSVVVFNDYTDQDWAVKASVVENKITADNEAQTEFDVTGFKINDVTVVGTGATGIVAKNADTKTTESNTGELTTAINSANIEFTDGNNVLKVGNKLSGTISYQLYNTATAD